ncbi:hypothetical protein [Cellulomonas sp. PSBB021]|uniref:hypothetical protein n=1 Tax=Cellulomonas sp. PSBB021 TaxID=2003551 RepID=UPI0018DFCA60|nr:hypothetical protein [Cellulomonas sp. PSBB021]
MRAAIACACSADAGHDDGISAMPYRYSLLSRTTLTVFTAPLSGPNARLPRLYRTVPVPPLAPGTLTTPPFQVSVSSGHVDGLVRYWVPSTVVETRAVPLAVEYVKVSDDAATDTVVPGAVPSVHVTPESRLTVTEVTPARTCTRIEGSSVRVVTFAGA